MFFSNLFSFYAMIIFGAWDRGMCWRFVLVDPTRTAHPRPPPGGGGVIKLKSSHTPRYIYNIYIYTVKLASGGLASWGPRGQNASPRPDPPRQKPASRRWRKKHIKFSDLVEDARPT